MLPGCTAIMLASFTLFPMAERTSGFKTLQLMTGVSGALYWFSNYVFDALLYALAWVLMLAVYAAQYPIGFHAAGKKE